MFDWWVAIVIGIIEGLTEFLPVSSTGHMILAGHMIGFTGDKAETFEIVIQLGAIMAVTIIYWRRIVPLFTMLLPGRREPERQKLNLLHILIAIVPAMLLAFLLADFIKGVLFSPQTVVIGLVLGGIFMIIAEKGDGLVKANDIDELTYRQTAMIGLAQCLSLWPGFSRSGATIAGGMMAGASRAAAADFTFIIAIPVMCAATVYELLRSYEVFTTEDFAFLAVGFIVSFVVALLAVITFIRLVQRLKLTYFSYYRFVLAAVMVLFMLFGWI
jgi:undecaprenyl-diphosphatase